MPTFAGVRCVRLFALAALSGGLLVVPPADAAKGPIRFAPHGLSKDRFKVATTATSVRVPAHDGVRLYARIFRPDTSALPSWRTPVVMVHSPYFDTALESALSNGLPYDEIIDLLTPKGYTVVLSDVRGTGNSGGCLEQDGANQARDFATLVEYFGTQSWSNGRVGSYGISYDGETQNAGGVLAPKHLATMITTAAISGLYETAYFDGVPYRGNGVVTVGVYAADSYAPPNDPTTLPNYAAERHGCQPAQFTNNADPSGDMTPYWAEREFRPNVGKIKASVLYVQGFQDRTVLPINIAGWYDPIRSFKRAVFGQWRHDFPDGDAGLGRADWLDIVHAWYDHDPGRQRLFGDADHRRHLGAAPPGRPAWLWSARGPARAAARAGPRLPLTASRPGE